MNKRELPSWYWDKGLHDAEITGTRFINFLYDVKKKSPIRNCFLIELNSEKALFECSVKTIKFYNAKIISGEFDFCKCWWRNDELQMENNKYNIKITCISSERKEFTIHLQFDYAETEKV